MKKTNLNILISLAIFIITFIPRLYKINNPIADWHSWRQADTAAVARNFIKDDFNILFPQSDSLLALNEHGLENPNRYFINEFPFYNALVAISYKFFGINTVFARLISIFFTSIGAVFLYLLVKNLFNYKLALITSLFYALNPYNVYYGRVIMPDPIFVSLSIISLYLCITWVKSQKWIHAILLSFIFGLAILIKPYAIFMALPIFYWALINKKSKLFTNKQSYFILLTSLLPFVLWRIHFNNHPEGSFASTWLLNGDNIRFTGAFFRWLIFERLNRLIFATGGFVLFIIGIINSYKSKKTSLIFVWLLSVIIYMTIFAMGNVNHDYYQLPIMPVGSILVAFGFWNIIKKSKNKISVFFNYLIATSLLLISLAFGWYEVKGYFNINHPEIIKAGQKADKLTPDNAIIIAPYQGDPAFLYQTNRHGWPIGSNIKDKIENGATHYVSVNFDDEASNLEKHCQVLKKESDYILIDLTTCNLSEL